MSTSCFVMDVSWSRVHLAVTVHFTGAPGLGGPDDGHDDSRDPGIEIDEAEHPDADPAGADGVQFMLVDGGRVLPVRTAEVSPGIFRLDINITNLRARRQIPDGTWRLVPYVDGIPSTPATYDLNDLDRLAEFSRTFIYNANRVSYMVSFGISEDDVRPDLLMRTYQMFRSPRAAVARKLPLMQRLRRRALPPSRRTDLLNRLYRVARRVQPPNGKRILFASEMRPRMEGNLLRIHDRMVERGLDRQFTLRSSFRAPNSSNKKATFRLVWLLATSDIVLIDDYFVMLQSLPISPDTKVIQAWHAGSGFKSIGYSRFGNYGSPKLQNAHRKYTYVITGSAHLVPVYAEAFGIEESAVIPTGLPRIDTFLDPARTANVVASFHAEFPQFTGKRIILFAPTFRGRGSKTAHYDYSRIDFARLYEVCGDDTVVLFRMHHFVQESIPIPPEFADRLFDFRAYGDTNDLLHLTDVLITDYSSIIYEYSLLDRPMLFFAYDKDVYGATRGFHRDYDLTAPGKVCTNMDELVEAIRDEDYDTWKIERFRRENFDIVDTNSGDRVIDQLILSDPRTSELPGEASVSLQTTSTEPAVGDSGAGGSAAADAALVGVLSGEDDEA